MKPPKRKKNYKITFVLTQYQLARVLTAIQAMESSYHPSSLNQMIKMITVDWIAKNNRWGDLTVGVEAQQEISKLMSQTKAGQRVMLQSTEGDEVLSKISKEVKSQQKRLPTIEIDLAEIEERVMGSLIKPQKSKTKSIVKVVTDFSPPTMEELNQEEE